MSKTNMAPLPRIGWKWRVFAGFLDRGGAFVETRCQAKLSFIFFQNVFLPISFSSLSEKSSSEDVYKFFQDMGRTAIANALKGIFHFLHISICQILHLWNSLQVLGQLNWQLNSMYVVVAAYLFSLNQGTRCWKGPVWTDLQGNLWGEGCDYRLSAIIFYNFMKDKCTQKFSTLFRTLMHITKHAYLPAEPRVVLLTYNITWRPCSFGDHCPRKDAKLKENIKHEAVWTIPGVPKKRPQKWKLYFSASETANHEPLWVSYLLVVSDQLMVILFDLLSFNRNYAVFRQRHQNQLAQKMEVWRQWLEMRLLLFLWFYFFPSSAKQISFSLVQEIRKFDVKCRKTVALHRFR